LPTAQSSLRAPQFVQQGSDIIVSGLPDEDGLIGAGVYYGAGASEASFCGDEHVHLVGGGNSAAQAAMHFSAVARKVTMIVRDGTLRETVSTYLVDRIYSAKNVEVLTNTEVIALIGEKFSKQSR